MEFSGLSQRQVDLSHWVCYTALAWASVTELERDPEWYPKASRDTTKSSDNTALISSAGP